MTPGEPSNLRCVVLVPTFNHGAALGGVLRSLDGCGLPIIVVNDGATDDTASILNRWLADSAQEGTRMVVGFSENKGKAEALRSGFALATRRGFTHALTIDSDGQHDPGDLPRIIAAANERPSALVVGARSERGAKGPLLSRVGRAISNMLVWIESGVRITDSQSGMRAYPLNGMAAIRARSGRYGFETEVLTLAGWEGRAVIEVPIRCIYGVPGGRTTHFRVGRDSFDAALMHARLIARALLPGPSRTSASAEEPVVGSIPRRLAWWFGLRRLRAMALGEQSARNRLAASFGVGVMMATLPLYGVKTLCCLWLSQRFRLHPLVVVGVSSLSTPPIGFVFAAVSIFVGHLVLSGEAHGLAERALLEASPMSVMSSFAMEWIVGSVVAGSVLASAAYLMATFLLRPRLIPRPPAQP